MTNETWGGFVGHMERCGWKLTKTGILSVDQKDVAEDLERSGIFDDNDAEIVKNPSRKILTKDELTEIQAKKGKNKNEYNLN